MTTHDPATEVEPDSSTGRRHRPLWQEALVLGACAVVVALVVKTFFVEAFSIPSASMEPGLVEHDRILVEKVSAWSGSPERGDVVVFEDPGGWLDEPDDSGGHLVKRVIGVAGDVITCCDAEGRIAVNGVPLDEDSYIRLGPDDACNGPMIPCEWSAGPVPDGTVFVMGDNRGRSADSTTHLCLPDETDCAQYPFVDVDLVVGTVFAVAWPLGRAGFVSDSDSFDDVPEPR